MKPRWIERILAFVLGYYWKPCPSCGQMTSGREAGLWSRNGHFGDIPTKPGAGRLICPRCAEAGAGCRAWAERRRYHYGCEHVPERVAPYFLESAPRPRT